VEQSSASSDAPGRPSEGGPRKRRLFLVGLFNQAAGGTGAVLLLFGPIGWALFVCWVIVVAWAGANLFADPQVVKVALRLGKWGAVLGACLGFILLAGLFFLAGINPHGGPTPAGEILGAALGGAAGGGALGAVVGFIGGASFGGLAMGHKQGASQGAVENPVSE
jgi:hypothetical protein